MGHKYWNILWQPILFLLHKSDFPHYEETNTFSKFNDHATEIVHHRKEHTAYIIHLRRIGRMAGVELTDIIHLLHTFKQFGDFRTKMFLNLLPIDKFYLLLRGIA